MICPFLDWTGLVVAGIKGIQNKAVLKCFTLAVSQRIGTVQFVP